MDITNEEKKAIAALKRVAAKWPETLWLYSANGTLHVMRKGEAGEQVTSDTGMDPEYSLATVNISNDGGDW